MTQEQLDEIVFDVIKELNDYIKISYLVSGGQTGTDEAGAKAGSKLGIETKVVFPKGWKFRGEDGKDIFDKEKFLKRFEGFEKIKFIEHWSYGYRERTKENAKCDVTISFSIKPNTPGEKLTKKSVLENGKIFISVDLNKYDTYERRLKVIVDIKEKLKNLKEISLNIAGNGLSNLI
jgi:hypothetical protein